MTGGDVDGQPVRQLPALLDERRKAGSIWIGRQHSAGCEIEKNSRPPARADASERSLILNG